MMPALLPSPGICKVCYAVLVDSLADLHCHAGVSVCWFWPTVFELAICHYVRTSIAACEISYLIEASELSPCA